VYIETALTTWVYLARYSLSKETHPVSKPSLLQLLRAMSAPSALIRLIVKTLQPPTTENIRGFMGDSTHSRVCYKSGVLKFNIPDKPAPQMKNPLIFKGSIPARSRCPTLIAPVTIPVMVGKSLQRAAHANYKKAVTLIPSRSEESKAYSTVKGIGFRPPNKTPEMG
jgi:hypothetical protein